MKNCNEIADELFKRREKYLKEKKRKQKAVISAVACICVVALLSFGVHKSGVVNSLSAELPDSTAKTTVVITESTTQASNNLLWTFNINDIISVKKGAKRYFDPKLYCEEERNAEETAEYFGIDLTKLNMPENLKFSDSESFRIIKAKDGALAQDCAAFHYTGIDRKVIIFASKLGYPCNEIFELETEYVTMMKNGKLKLIEVTVGYMKNDDGKDFYIADFEYKGVTYHIETENIKMSRPATSKAPLHQIISEIIDK